jgi:UDP-N-acetylmuramoyl-L-alanyl-D-glutamate--2,6-diaminopimelate ligase
MRLAELCNALPEAHVPRAAAGQRVRAVRDDSRDVRAGDLFVAVPGAAGAAGAAGAGRGHARQAAARGAVAIVSETPLAVRVPVVLVPDARRALAALAAAAAGHPARRLRLVGITGTVGKTSVLTMLGEILRAADIRAGTIGSLGIEHAGGGDATAYTTPGALQLQQSMAGMVAAGTRVLAMEVTSHALLQGRVHGLTYELGIFTNLAMLEHLEYHGSLRAYVDAKRRFLDHLDPRAPLIYAAGDRAVRQIASAHPGPLIACGGHSSALVTVRRDRLTVHGTRLTLTVRKPLPRLHAPALAPIALTVQLPVLGRTNIGNATLAAVAGLCLGAEPGAVQEALASLEPPRRRLEVIRAAGPCIIDDTVGHPDSITGVFEVAERVPHRRLHIVFCVRGRRGPVINARDAEALAIWGRRVPIHRLITTSAVESADDRNTVAPAERDAFLGVLERAGLPHMHRDRLDAAIGAALDGCGEGDLLLLLGAQGMDAGAQLVRQRLGTAAARG